MLVSRNQIAIIGRQRTTIEAGPLAELRTSIEQRGLMHAPVVRPRLQSDATECPFVLVAGERRLTAIDNMAKDGVIFKYNATQNPDTKAWLAIDIEPGTVPITVSTLDTIHDILSAEFEENAMRQELSWQDRARALAAIHAQRVEQNPAQTLTATAKEIADKGGVEGAKTPTYVRKMLSESTILAGRLSDPAVAKARTHEEALKLVLQRDAEAVTAEMLRRRSLRADPAVVEPIVLMHGSSHDVLPELKEHGFDLILTDPPYGIGADSAGFRSRTVQHHNYKDTPEAARAAISLCLIEGWRVTKLNANIFLFCDIDHFDFFKKQAGAMGWTPFRTPITWQKSLSEGLAPWGHQGPRRTTEWIFYATKGQRGLLAPILDVLTVKRVHRSERVFGAQKPIDLMRQLIECSTLPGDSVLDPFLGSGSSMAAARLTGRTGLGIEVEEATLNTAKQFVFGKDEDLYATDEGEAA